MPIYIYITHGKYNFAAIFKNIFINKIYTTIIPGNLFKTV
jgi:hypothetical protein